MTGNKYTAADAGHLNSADVTGHTTDSTGAAIGSWAAAGKFTCPWNPAPDAPESSHYVEFTTPGTLHLKPAL